MLAIEADDLVGSRDPKKPVARLQDGIDDVRHQAVFGGKRGSQVGVERLCGVEGEGGKAEADQEEKRAD
jgi:hypothetical protein